MYSAAESGYAVVPTSTKLEGRQRPVSSLRPDPRRSVRKLLEAGSSRCRQAYQMCHAASMVLWLGRHLFWFGFGWGKLKGRDETFHVRNTNSDWLRVRSMSTFKAGVCLSGFVHWRKRCLTTWQRSCTLRRRKLMAYLSG